MTRRECLLRDHLLAVHPKTVQPETRSVLLRQLRRDGGAAAGWRFDPSRCAPTEG